MLDSLINIAKSLIILVSLAWIGFTQRHQIVSPSANNLDLEATTEASASSVLVTKKDKIHIKENPPELQVQNFNNIEPPQYQSANPTPVQNQAAENYKLEAHPSGEEGHYIMRNAPKEAMSTVEELNIALNSYREAHGLSKLHIDPQICDIAAERAVEANEEFSHAKFKEHVEKGDYNYTGFKQIGENLFDGSFSGVHIVEYGWDQSPSHRPNMHLDWVKGCAGIYGSTAAFVFAK